jgi:hypothetical protein
MRPVMVNVCHVPGSPVDQLFDGPQFESGDADGDIETGLALEAQWLKCERIIRPCDQGVGIAADPHYRASTAIITPKIARADLMDRREHGPLQRRLLGKAEIQADAAHHSVITVLRPPGRGEHARQ